MARDDIIPLDMGEDTKKILGCLAGIDLEWYAERLAGLPPQGGAGTKGSGDKEER